MAAHVLVVVTSFGYIEAAKRQTGWYLPELAHPYDVMAQHNIDITIASPRGGTAPIDPTSIETTAKDTSATSFLRDKVRSWANTIKIADILGKTDEFAAIFFPGGAGPMFDLSTDPDSQQLIAEFVAAKKPVAAVCHGPIALQGVVLPNGEHFVANKTVTALSDAEEEYFGFQPYVPFSLEKRLQERGAKYVKAADTHGEKVVVDGNLITGQNVASARAVGVEIVKMLGHSS